MAHFIDFLEKGHFVDIRSHHLSNSSRWFFTKLIFFEKNFGTNIGIRTVTIREKYFLNQIIERFIFFIGIFWDALIFINNALEFSNLYVNPRMWTFFRGVIFRLRFSGTIFEREFLVLFTNKIFGYDFRLLIAARFWSTIFEFYFQVRVSGKIFDSKFYRKSSE